ncbi:MAG: hypothetical protein IJ906_08685 [Oscillospiraceae bacterium]|nr:hypothetical protein [Oscillospiraceae bacterium]
MANSGYTKVREAVPKIIGIRNFECEVRKRQQVLNAAARSETLQILSLKGIHTPGMLVPEGWTVTSHRITHLELVFAELRPVPVSSEPLFVSAKLVNVDDGTEKPWNHVPPQRKIQEADRTESRYAE